MGDGRRRWREGSAGSVAGKKFGVNAVFVSFKTKRKRKGEEKEIYGGELKYFICEFLEREMKERKKRRMEIFLPMKGNLLK